MKAEILKIAGVKNEKEFYKKYPSEEAFMKVHGKEFKKAKLGKAIAPKAQDGIGSYTGGETVYNPQPLSFQNAYDTYDLQMTGSTNAQRQAQAQRAQQAQLLAQAVQKPAGGGMGGMDISKIMGMMGGSGSGAGAGATDLAGGADVGELTSAAGGMAKKGKKVAKYQNSGPGLNSPAAGTTTGIQAAGTNPYTQEDWNSCGPNQYWDGVRCVDINPQASGITAVPAEYDDFEYQEVPKFQTNPTLSTGTPKTGPGTGNNPSADVAKQDPMDAIAKYSGLAGKVYGGIKKLKAEREARKSAEQQASVSELSLKAALSKPEQQKRKYNRPEDALIQPEQLFPSYGVGTNVLTARDGMQIGGNMTEIQNMYNPGDIYSDLGYEPLSDSDIIKQYRAGGLIRRLGGGGGTPWGSIGTIGQSIGQSATGNNAGGTIGGEVGGAIGMAVGGPAGQAIGQTVGAVAGGLLNSNPRKMEKAQNKTKRNVQTAAAYSMGQGLQSQYSSYVRNGGDIPYAEAGWVSNDWMPQIITQFGEHSMKDLLRPDPMMDTLRTGGNISQNKMFPQDQYALGGELKTTWGGYTETISRNPFEASETGIFRGKSHEESDGNGHTGIGVKYGDGGHDSYTDYAEFGSENADADVEVERGEPYKKDAKGNMLVAGNLVASKEAALDAGKKDFAGMKYKNIIKKLAEQDKTYTKNIDKASSKLAKHSDSTPFGILEEQTLAKIIEGNLMKLEKNKISSDIFFVHQDATNETAKEYGVDADALAKGKIKIDKEAQKEMAKYGKILKAQTGITYPVYDANGNITSHVDESGNPVAAPTQPATTTNDTTKYTVRGAGSIDYNDIGSAGNDELWGNKEKYEKNWKPKVEEALSDPKRADAIIQSLESYTGQDAKDVIAAIKAQKTRVGKIAKIQELGTDSKIGPYHNLLNQTIDITKPPVPTTSRPPLKTITPPDTGTPPAKTSTTTPVPPIKRNSWMDVANELFPYLRPSDVDYNVDLYPEMMAAAMNREEPVFAQGYQPQLLTPYDISYQDQLNEITAQARASERLAGQNPAAAAAILATASGEKNKVLGEQFRQNQATRMGTYDKNIATLNDAQLKNLAIYADQAAKQSQARSNTKAQAMEIEKSMADKIAKNKLENKTLQMYENLYNFRFGKDGRAQNYNPLAQFDVTVGGSGTGKSSSGLPSLGDDWEWDTTPRPKKKKKDEDNARNGSIVRALKNF